MILENIVSKSLTYFLIGLIIYGAILCFKKPVAVVKTYSPDKYLKDLSQEMFGVRNIRRLTYDKDFTEQILKIHNLKIPKTFVPDYIVSNDHTCVFVEFDEGGDFHSGKNASVNYISKWLKYNDLLINREFTYRRKTHKLVIVRLTYTVKKFNDNDSNYVKRILKKLITMALSGKYTGCYILGIYSDRKCAFKVIPNEMIVKNPTYSAVEFFES